MALLADTASINTILGEGSSFSDGVRISGNVRVEGDIDGSVDATGSVFVGERARIRGDVSADSAEIFGIVLGDVYAPESVRLRSTAAVVGDVYSRRVSMDDGVIFHGHCISLVDEAAFAEARESWRTERAVLGSSLGGNGGGRGSGEA